jgi:DNA (cytosine-5)-methyltransferase 1
MLKHLDLFSGIGGFSLGFEKTSGFETVAFCEKDKFCQSVLKKHWNNIRIYDEIRNLKGKEINADVVTGGFPCQPFSVAGKRKGTDDDRYLWDEMLRVITEVKARWIVGENVAGIVNIQEGKVLQQIQKDLESEGFQVQCLIIPASGVGAWHQRKRIFVIGCNVSNSDNNGSHRPKRNATIESGNEQKDRLSIGNDKDVSNSKNRIRKQTEWQRRKSFGRRSNDRSWLENERSKAKSNVSNSNGERQQKQLWSKPTEKEKSGFECESWWQTQSRICGIPDGIQTKLDKDRANRIKALGNSIVPEIAYEIAKAILVAENEQSH